MCVFRLYRQLRQSVNICAGSSGYSVDISLSILSIAIRLAQKLVCRPSSLLEIGMFALVELYIPYPTFFFLVSIHQQCLLPLSFFMGSNACFLEFCGSCSLVVWHAPSDRRLCLNEELGYQTKLFNYPMGNAQTQCELSPRYIFQDNIMDQAWNKWRPHNMNNVIWKCSGCYNCNNINMCLVSSGWTLYMPPSYTTTIDWYVGFWPWPYLLGLGPPPLRLTLPMNKASLSFICFALSLQDSWLDKFSKHGNLYRTITDLVESLEAMRPLIEIHMCDFVVVTYHLKHSDNFIFLNRRDL